MAYSTQMLIPFDGRSVPLAAPTVDEWSRQTPDALAVSAGGWQLTYSGLQEAAERLAGQLQARQVNREILVAILIPRSVALVVAELAVLKAGGAYLPLDPAAPRERTALLLREAGVQLVLAPECDRERVPAGPWEVIGLNPVGRSTLEEAPPFTPVESRPDDLAYVIFTSGSTGAPKGVEITHGNLGSLIQWHRQAFGVTSQDRATVMASPGFDASVWEIWPYLASGASLWIPEDSLRAAREGLRDWLVSRKITVTFQPTAIAERLLDLKWPVPGTLRFLLTGADTLRRRPPAGLPFRLVNNYGPTECTVVATSAVIPPEGDPGSSPPIGRAIDGTVVDIRDGELYIGGAGVGRGYRRQPGLTAERFLTDPATKIRFYRTGDRARWLPDGQILFLGRVDDQVKVRGYRIEPGEIVRTLLRNPDVTNAVVVAADAPNGEKQLVAYLVPAASARLSDQALRTGLREHLPEYMIPASFVVLDELPGTDNGKVDRLKLPEATPENTLRDESFADPESPVESALSDIVKDLVRVDRIGVRDNFFLLGGHSLLGAQLIERVNQAFGVELSLLTVFENPTVRDLAGHVEKAVLARIETMSEDEARVLVGA
ncbi:MAG: non-ribosomal peptide synthetase [Verrucomicrobiales bacterium]|nr:non-ribosomal peptide synthetase [Verrucomicrobiales bacterium]